MSKKILFLMILGITFTLFMITGCIEDINSVKDLTPFVKEIPQMKEFLQEYPNTKIVITYWSKEEINQIIGEINEKCGKELTASAMYKAVGTENNEKITAWIRVNDRQVLCIVREIEERPKENINNEKTDKEEDITSGAKENVTKEEEESEKIPITEQSKKEVPQETKEKKINESLLKDIEQCKEDLKDEKKVHDYENVCECSYIESDICKEIEITFTYDVLKTTEYWFKSKILKDMCVCGISEEIEDCEEMPLDESAYIFDYTGSNNWNDLKNSINNYCQDFNAISSIELEDEDDYFFYTKLDINRLKLRDGINDKADGWPYHIYLKFSKINSTYYEKRISKNMDEYINMIVELHGAKLENSGQYASLWAVYSLIYPIELKEIVEYDWIKRITPSYKPCDDELCPPDNPDCCA